MSGPLRPGVKVALLVSGVAGMVIAIWLVAAVAGWNEELVLEWIPDSSVLAAAVIVALLVADTVLPIPATIVMLGSGILLGPVAGSLANGAGLLLGAIAGYGVGRLFPARSVGVGSLRPLLVAGTRGLPVLSESFAIGAGAIGYPLTHFVRAAGAGSFAVGTVYSLAGSTAGDHWSLVFVACGLASPSYVLATRVLGTASVVATSVANT